MTRMAAIFRFILFAVFFSVGASAVTLSIIADQIEQLYESRAVLAHQQAETEQLKSLIDDHIAQITVIQHDPNVLDRLEYSMFGTEPTAEDTAFPKASAEQLQAAQLALIDQIKDSTKSPATPQWLTRTLEPRFRYSLFLAGAGLILITFIFFGSPAKISKK